MKMIKELNESALEQKAFLNKMKEESIRKPTSWGNFDRAVRLDRFSPAVVDKYPVLSMEQVFGSKEANIYDDTNPDIPMEFFIIGPSGRKYFVDRQGYDYIRYATLVR